MAFGTTKVILKGGLFVMCTVDCMAKLWLKAREH